jgi:hypothetical protein
LYISLLGRRGKFEQAKHFVANTLKVSEHGNDACECERPDVVGVCWTEVVRSFADASQQHDLKPDERMYLLLQCRRE